MNKLKAFLIVVLFGAMAVNPLLTQAHDGGSDNHRGRGEQGNSNSASSNVIANSNRHRGNAEDKNRIERDEDENENKIENEDENEEENENENQNQNRNDITAPSILFATNFGLQASTTRLIWVTNESSNSKIWFGTTTPVSTSTAPMAFSNILSFFHDLLLPNLATSTHYFYTISSTDASGNTGFFSNSFTTPSI